MCVFCNYHRHTDASNIMTPDSSVNVYDYVNRTKELDHKILSAMEHGFQGRYFQTYDIAKKNGLKFIFGTEAYWVKDRFEKDNTNCHICLFAKSEKGRRDINRIISEANLTGYYYKPRIDLNLISTLDPNEVFVTSACFTDKMSVKTSDGYKKINDVRAGELVLTHKNTWEKVLSPTKRNYKDKLYYLNIEGNFNQIECTKDHKFPTITKTHDNVTKKILWKRADELTLKDRILSVVDTRIEDVESLDFTKEIYGIRKIPRNRKNIKDTDIQITNHFLELLGLYAAEGNFQNSHGILFTFHQNETNLINKVIEYSTEIFGVLPKVKNKKGSKAVSVEILSTEIYLIFRSLFNHGAKNKNIPEFIHKISPHKQMQFLKGLILGDGHVKKDNKRLTLVSISKEMTYAVSNILERNNIKHSIRKIAENVDKNNVRHQESYYTDINLIPFVKYWIDFENTDKDYDFNVDEEIKWKSKKWVEIDGVLYQHKKVKNITSSNFDGYVYCLNVENTPSFKLECISVHNCIAFWHYEDAEKIALDLYSYFGKNFMLEVQAHNTLPQKELHRKILKLSDTHNIELIAGCDSHFIYPEQSIDRDNVLEAKGIRYEHEDGWYMDYPDGETLKRRFLEQGVLSEKQIDEAIKNTLLFMDFDDYDSDKIKVFSKDIKLPTLYPELNQEQKDRKYKDLLNQKWREVKASIPKEKHQLYIDEIRKEGEVVINTGMTDYFLIDHEIVKEAVNNGGIITSTGRGSGVSFYTNTLLGFSKVDRISSPVKLYPERFMSESRILQTKSLPDLDLNLGNPKVFVEAQNRILGEGHAYPMIAYGTFKRKSGFKLYAKSQNLDFDIANEVSKQLEKYENDLKYADEDEQDLIDVFDYVDEKYHHLIKESEKYTGIVSDKKPHPCGFLLYQGNIKEEIGLIKLKSESTKKEVVACLIDGDIAETFKFLKNDLLKVDVAKTIDDTYKRIGKPIHSENELLETIKGDSKVWDIYAKGLTVGVNQVEKYSTTQKAIKYKPKNISELTAFIAAIRPAFKSMYSIFESRKPFSYGISSFDDIIQTEEMPNSFVLYQEQTMATLAYAGFPSDETYGIIKAISKKKPDVVKPLKERFLSGFSEKILSRETVSYDEAMGMSDKVWQIIEDSSGYGFNASHAYSYALDSVYCAYLKSHHTIYFYETLLRHFSEKKNKDKVALLKDEMQRGFNILDGGIKFGYDNRAFVANEKENKIYADLASVKYMNTKVAEELFHIGPNKYDCFTDVLITIEEQTTLTSRQLKILITLNYFSDFGENNLLLHISDIFFNGKDAYKKGHTEKTKLKRVPIIKDKEQDLIMNMSIQERKLKPSEQIPFEIEHMGYAQSTYPELDEYHGLIIAADTQYSPKLSIYNLKTGEVNISKISKKTYNESDLTIGSVIKNVRTVKKPKKKRGEDGNWVDLPENEFWIENFQLTKL